MGFFDRNRDQLLQSGIDPDRLPPGQYQTDRFPVLHAGSVPRYKDLSEWTFSVTGLVDNPVTLSWPEIIALPTDEVTVDIHCVTKWSKFNTKWKGVPFSAVYEMAGVHENVTHIMCHSEYGFTTNLPLRDLLGDNVALLAYNYDDKPLEPDHGYPLRFFVPRLYFWKSAKWLRGIEFMADDRPGFWEQNGYHMYGDPWKEQRYWDD
ncbi:MAG: sulfite oxidase-like oxidoreductase [Acidimicrobiaceae bacterium]|nr:sulfite oxidase-like oxidoreductase [Acidimicrobiaceae bacterium]